MFSRRPFVASLLFFGGPFPPDVVVSLMVAICPQLDNSMNETYKERY